MTVNYTNVLWKKIDTYDVLDLLILAHAHAFSFNKAGFYEINFLFDLKKWTHSENDNPIF